MRVRIFCPAKNTSSVAAASTSANRRMLPLRNAVTKVTSFFFSSNGGKILDKQRDKEKKRKD